MRYSIRVEFTIADQPFSYSRGFKDSDEAFKMYMFMKDFLSFLVSIGKLQKYNINIDEVLGWLE